MERIENIPSYSAAFDSLSMFYKRKAGRPKLYEMDSNEIDLTGDSDEEGSQKQSGPPKGVASHDAAIMDAIDLAAGVPGEVSRSHYKT